MSKEVNKVGNFLNVVSLIISIAAMAYAVSLFL